MSYELCRYIFYGSAILAGIMLITSILLFVLLKIPTVIGDLNGSNARKAIDSIRTRNELTGSKTYKSSAVNYERGKITGKMSTSGRMPPVRHDFAEAMPTEKINKKAPIVAAGATTVLAETNNETTVLNAETSSETTLLAGSSVNETTVLERNQSINNVFEIEYELTYIHTNEVIS